MLMISELSATVKTYQAATKWASATAKKRLSRPPANTLTLTDLAK